MRFFTDLLEHYGYAVLFFGLMLELIALPLPGEFMMTYAGLIVFQGKLNWGFSILAAGAGACLGMTFAYWIGYRLGRPFFEKYGSRIHFGPDKLDNVSHWFQRYGNKLLLFAFFIPGVRHITGYFSGVTRLSFRTYAAYAYSGAILWVTVFISLGRLLGPQWTKYHHVVSRYLIIFGLLSALIYLGIYVYRKHKDQLILRLVTIIDRAFTRYRSMGRVRITIVAAFAAFIIFVSLMIGLIQDLLAHEFAEFDEVAAYIVHRVFGPEWTGTMNRFALVGTYLVYTPLIVITALWIWFKGKDRLLELSILVLVIVGGEALTEVLPLWFHRTGPTGYLLTGFTFPSEQTMLSLTVLGFSAFLLFRHYGHAIVQILAVCLVLAACLLVGISRVYFNVQYASDVAAGYVFGGVWLTLNMILLEVLRTMRNFRKTA